MSKKFISFIGIVVFSVITALLEEVMTQAMIEDELDDRGYTKK